MHCEILNIPRATGCKIEGTDLLLPLDNGRTLVIDINTIVSEYDLDDIQLFDHGVGVMLGRKCCLRVESCLEMVGVPGEGCSLR